MKQYKIYTKGNYIVIVDVQKNEYFYGIRKEVHIDKSNVNKAVYRAFKVKDFSSSIILAVPNILKEDGTPYSEAEFDTFYQENTGNFNGGGSAPTQVVIEVTRAEVITLQATASFVVGATYVITDADTPLYGGTEVTLTAITPSELSLQGSGKFYCPKYDLSTPGYDIWTKYMKGTFSNVVGTFFSGQTVTAQNGATAKYLAAGLLNYVSGDWSGATTISGADVSGFVSPSYSVGQIVHWGGKSWTNVNGEIGAGIDKYTLDAEWTEIPFNETDYNVYVDEIQYDFGNDMIIYRKDRYNNVVSGSNQVFVEFESPGGFGYGNPIKDFQWGCAQDNFNTDDYLYIGIQGNQVIDSYFETLNSLAEYIWFNELSQFSYIFNNTLSGSYIQYNTLSGRSSIENNTLSGSYIQYNTLSNSSIENNTLSGSYIQYNTLSNSYIQNNTLSGTSSISNNTLGGYSYIQYNTLNSNSYISNNTLSGNSSIYSNTLSSNSYFNSNTLNSNSYISNNTLSNSSYIYNNTLSNGTNIKNNTFINNSILRFSGGSLVSKTLTRLNMEGNNTSISITATIIFNQNISKTIFKRQDGASRLQYVNNSDVIVITNVNA